MNAAISGVCALVIGALTYTVIAASGREGFEAKLGALLAFALTFGGVHVAREWWFDNADRSATARTDTIESAWRTDPILVALKRYRPEVYRFTLATVDSGATRDRLPASGELIWAGRHEADFRTYFGSWLRVASDEAVIAYGQALVAAGTELGERDASLCARYLFPPSETEVDLHAARPALAALSAATTRADTSAAAAVIESAAEQPKPAPTANRVNKVLQPVLRGLYDEYGAEWQALNRAFERGTDPAQLCRVTTSFYRRVLELPASDAGDVLRLRLTPHA